MRILITAGPTREAIDPVRYISNRSSGRMGYALAAEAQARGHHVLLVSGPATINTPEGCRKISVESADEMFDAVAENIDEVDAAIMSAAVSDYAPVHVAVEKIKKNDQGLMLELGKTRDILAAVREKFHFQGLLVGFAAETENLRLNALKKLKQKECDLMVANGVSRREIGFDSDNNEVTIFRADGNEKVISRQLKKVVACAILDALDDLGSK